MRSGGGGGGETQRHHIRKKRRLNSEIESLNTESSTICQSSPESDCSNRNSQTQSRYKRKAWTICEETETPREWVFSTRDYSKCKEKIVFVSYNILGVENASNHPDLYNKVPHEFLDWDRRKEQIRKEITRYNASILCFQAMPSGMHGVILGSGRHSISGRHKAMEVDRFDDLDCFLQKDGFTGVYRGRTGKSCDGCAIFWRTELFTVLHIENIEFKRFDLRDNVAQLCVLKMNTDIPNTNEDSQSSGVISSRNVLVGNIHVLFNPKRGDIKLGQVRIFLEKAHELSQQWGNIPVILGGDLNSIPQSAMYQFLSSSELDIRLHERRIVSGQISPFKYPPYLSYKRNTIRWTAEELRLATGTESGTHVKHQLKLRSAYLGVPGSSRKRDKNGEPLATSYHSHFMGTVDYIWHTEDLAPVRVLETLTLDNLRKLGGLPSENFGSDHLALVCELAFVDNYISD